MKIPQHEDPINSVQDLLKRNISIFKAHYLYVSQRNNYLRRNTTEWNYVANNMDSAYGLCTNGTLICADINGTYQYYVKHHLHGNKTHAVIRGFLFPSELDIMPEKKNWWRSEKIDDGKNPYSSIPTSRNWILKEVNFACE